MKKGINKNGAETRSRILAIGKELFFEKGFFSVSIAEICRQADIAPGNFNYYFPTKIDLVGEILRDYQARCVAFAEQITPEGSSDALAKCIQSHTIMLSLARDESTSRFLLDVYEDPKSTHLIRNLLESNYSITLSSAAAAQGPKGLMYFISADTHIKLGLFRDLMLRTGFHPTRSQVLECAEAMFLLFGRLFYLEEAEVRSALDTAREIFARCGEDALPALI